MGDNKRDGHFYLPPNVFALKCRFPPNFAINFTPHKFKTINSPIPRKFKTTDSPIPRKFKTINSPISRKFKTTDSPISRKF